MIELKTRLAFQSQVLFSPLGESALFVSLIGVAAHPNPNGTINIKVPAKDVHVEPLPVYNISEVGTEVGAGFATVFTQMTYE